MKSLSTLIRILKLSLNEERKEINTFLDQKNNIINRQKALEDQIKEEEKEAYKNIQLNLTFFNYKKAALKQQESLKQEGEKISLEIEKIQQSIENKFKEIKQYELIQEKKQQEEAEEEKRKENSILDEIALRKGINKNSN